MDAAMASHPFANPKNREATTGSSRAIAAGSRSPSGRSSGMVGLEVRRQKNFTAYEPGMVFTIEPALTIPDDRVYIRLGA